MAKVPLEPRRRPANDEFVCPDRVLAVFFLSRDAEIVLSPIVLSSISAMAIDWLFRPSSEYSNKCYYYPMGRSAFVD